MYLTYNQWSGKIITPFCAYEEGCFEVSDKELNNLTGLISRYIVHNNKLIKKDNILRLNFENVETEIPYNFEKSELKLIIDKKEILWGRDYSINITYLTLPDSGLSGTLPSEIGKFVNLIYLDLNNNEIVGEIPYEIGNLINLVYLDLSSNQLSGEVPSSFSNLVNLGIIKLSNNLLNGVLNDTICNFEQGSVFQIENNKFCPPYPSCVNLVGSQDTPLCN